VAEVRRWLLEHLHDHYSLYGEATGVRSARKHIGWYVRELPGGEAFRSRMNTPSTTARRRAGRGRLFDACRRTRDADPAANRLAAPTTNQALLETCMSKKTIDECVRAAWRVLPRPARHPPTACTTW
jgi:tRNA-dihydrouridine synthase B